jgi:hypothetical protein
MTQPQVTPHMQILLPTIEVSLDYSELLYNAFNIIDNHDHHQIGLVLSEKSILWNSLALANKSILNINSLIFQPLNETPTVNNCLYFISDPIGIDLIFTNSLSDIRITAHGSVSFYQPVDGFFGNFAIVNASVVYNLSLNNYTFNLGTELGSIEAYEIDVSNNIKANKLVMQVGSYSIKSSGFFYDVDSVLCTEGNPESKIKFETIQIGMPIATSTNPRLATSVNQLNNIQTMPYNYYRQIRYDLPIRLNHTGLIKFGGTPVSGTCDISLIKGTFTSIIQQSSFDYQTPANEAFNQSATSLTHNVGAMSKITPNFTETIGEVEVYTLFKSNTLFIDPLMLNGNKMFHLTILVNNSSVNPQISLFEEYHAFDEQPIQLQPQTLAYSAYFKFQVIDLNTNLPITDYFAMVRI